MVRVGDGVERSPFTVRGSAFTVRGWAFTAANGERQTPSKRLQFGFYIGPPTFEKWRQRETVSKLGRVFIDRESRTIGGQFKQNLIWLAEINALEVIAVDLSAVRDPQIPEAVYPPVQSLRSADTQTGATYAVVAIAFAWRIGPIEERQIAAGRPASICIEQMISADVVLVYGLLDQTHAEAMGIELMVSMCVGGDRSDVMKSE
jgi:hypothetical protein